MEERSRARGLPRTIDFATVVLLLVGVAAPLCVQLTRSNQSDATMTRERRKLRSMPRGQPNSPRWTAHPNG